jgi:O-antigen ligase/polysaccharide polymerase Wzy-like membrane protein
VSVSVAGARDFRAWPRGTLIAVALALVAGLLTALLVNEWAGAAILVLGLVLTARPLDFFVSFLLVAGATAFVEYGDPKVQRDLAIVLILTTYATASFMTEILRRRWALPSSPLTIALLGLAISTAVAVVHGVAVGNPIRFLLVELFSLFLLGFAVAVGGIRLRSADLRIAEWTFALAGVAISLIGFIYFGTFGIRTGGMAFSPMPGFAALILISLALFDPAPRVSLARVLLFCVVIAHQVVSFTRGYWLGLLVGIPLICIAYGGRGTGARRRWSKVFRTLGLAGMILFAGAMVATVQNNWSDIVTLLINRFTSSFTTKNTPETISNIARLVEIRTSLNSIARSPWLGHGHGAMLVVRQFYHPQTGPQWFIHQSYVMMSVKQGLIGLVALIWVLVAAVRLGLRGASHPDRQLAGWCVASASCTVFAAIVGLTNYFFFVATQNSLLAVVWGISIAAQKRDTPWLVWRLSRRPSGEGGAPSQGESWAGS